MNAPAFSVIIPVFNKWELTAACLRSLREHTPEYEYEVLVADNASSDATAAELPELGKSLFGERFTSMRFEQNRNFGPACNAAAAAATAPLLFFLNNDTILTPGWAPPLLKALAEDKKLAGVGPLLLYENNTVQHLGVTFDVQSVEHLYRGFPADHAVARKHRYFQVITAAAFMLPAAVFHKHAGFYEEYRNGFEDVDLCLRIHATGKKFTCVPDSKIYHLESQSPGRLEGDDRNAELLFERCKHLYRIDKHLFAREDGFEPFIDDGFGIGYIVNKANSEALLKEAQDQPLACWTRLLAEHPLWLEGRMMVARTLEEHGHYAEAFALQMEIANLQMSAAAFAWLGRKAARLGNSQAEAYAERVREKLQSRRDDRAYTLMLIEFVREKKAHDLAGMLENALRERFP